MEIVIDSLGQIDAKASEFLSHLNGRKLIAFRAPMGAGKTTFISAVCRALGVKEDAISSPTFAIVNEYRANGGEPVYHFDFYRITKNSEALDIGLWDYFDSGCLCLMEWPENIEDLLPEEVLNVNINVREDGARTISFNL